MKTRQNEDGTWTIVDGGAPIAASLGHAGPHATRKAARAALAHARGLVEARPHALLIARTDALAVTLRSEPPCARNAPSCFTDQEDGDGGRRPFGDYDTDHMCGACAALWHVSMAAEALRRVQQAEEEIAAERDGGMGDAQEQLSRMEPAR